jgi:transcriptional regulator with XRE-family HTH domain
VAKHKIDKGWFLARQQDLGMSGTEFAKRLGMDKGSWSRTLAGSRKMTDEEKVKAAKIIGVPLHELLPHVGLPVRAPGHDVGVAGIVDGDGEVTFDRRGITAPEAMLLIHDNRFLDGWGVVCRPAQLSATLSGEYLMGIVQTKDGRRLLRTVRPAARAGRFDLGPVFGFGIAETDVEIVGVVPVEGIRRV